MQGVDVVSLKDVDWEGLSKINELQEYFEQDYSGFQELIEQAISQVEKFSQDDLMHLAELRVLEVTNGCVQWGFRLNNKHSLPADKTRESMRKVIGFINEQKLYFPSKGTIAFDPEVKIYMKEFRELYWQTFKYHLPGADRQFYAGSAGQFIACGRQRLEAAMELVRKDYEALFSPYFIERGRKYLAPYLACI
ncbi:hypothetical protein H6G13_21240 [Pseudanabaena sp. FACHB-2040]|nr:hypothetical protein [Pseudanabaena sp. FACHB-2040]